MNVKKHIPNLLTLANLFCGILAIKVGFTEHYYLAGFFVIFGAIFDFFDGFAARLLKVQGELGKQLDSLADMVTFGVAPGVVMYSFLKTYFHVEDPYSYVQLLIPFVAFVIPLMSAVRLAKFNIDTNQTDKFIGLPTPANALFFVFIPTSLHALIGIDVLNLSDIFRSIINSSTHEEINRAVYYWVSIKEFPTIYFVDAFYQPMFICLIFMFSYLLNAPIEMIALKFKSFAWKGNEIRFIFLGLCLVVILLSLLISSVFVSVPIIILLYIVLSVVNNLFKKKQNELQS